MKNVLSIQELFTGRLFRVPDYQRGYAWEKQHLTDFLEDLELLPTGKNHYTGTIVLHQYCSAHLLPVARVRRRRATFFGISAFFLLRLAWFLRTLFSSC
jgi:hypothetical protein